MKWVGGCMQKMHRCVLALKVIGNNRLAKQTIQIEVEMKDKLFVYRFIDT